MREFDADEFARQILEPVPVGVGAGELGGDLGAIDGCRHHAEGVAEHGHVEAAEMEEFDDIRVGQHSFEIGRVLLAGLDLHHLGVAVAARKLNQAQTIAPDGEAQGFGVDRDGFAEGPVGGEVGAVQANGQARYSFLVDYLRRSHISSRGAHPFPSPA